MANELIHNKWHAFNHFTVPLEGFPDSGTDPIAAKDYPFQGIFYNSLSGFFRNIGRSDSAHWWFYSSTTKAHSGWWELYPYVLSTTITLSSDWDLGYSGYTTLYSNSAKYVSVHTTSYFNSGADQYDLRGGVGGPGGIGWHIALSATCHRLNEAQSNIYQKVAVPVRLLEQGTSLIWDLSAQTVYVNLTGNYEMYANEVIGLKKGGKYTMWAYIDRCPEENMNIVFDEKYYNIAVKVLSGTEYTYSLSNVLRLSSSSITRIDFTCDGEKMLGKATHYSIWVPTEKDLYFKGLGLFMTDPRNGRSKSPVYVNTNKAGGTAIIGIPAEIGGTGEWLIAGEGVNIIEDYLSNFTAPSSLYVDGPPLSGIRFRYLNANTQYINFVVYNANWATSKQLSYSRSLTGSFDRIVGTLSGKGDFRNPIYAQNLICSPGEDTIINNLQFEALPTPPYELVSSNIREVVVCTSSYEVEIYSGKDREIDSVFVNGNEINIQPVKYNGFDQPYNFNNERTCTVKFSRIQEDNTIEAFFRPQYPITIPNNILWFNSQDSSLLNNEAGPVIDFYISWNMGTTVITSYNVGEPVLDNNNDRPRINTYRTDGTYINFMSAGFEVLCGKSSFFPWGDRLSGFNVTSIPVPGGLNAGVDFFTSTSLAAPILAPSIGNWSQSIPNPGELLYKFQKSPADYKTPTTIISIGLEADTPTWPIGSYPTIKTWESTTSTTSVKPLTTFYSNTLDNIKLFQYNLPNAPEIITSGSLRGVELKNGKFMTLNRQLSVLKGRDFFQPFTTFTVLSTPSNLNSDSVIWWLGDFNNNENATGYGLLLKGNKLYNTVNQRLISGELEPNKLYIISTTYGERSRSNRVLINAKGSYNRIITKTQEASSFNFIIGKNPDSNNNYCNGLIIFDFYMFNRAFNFRDLLKMNLFLIDKFDSFG